MPHSARRLLSECFVLLAVAGIAIPAQAQVFNDVPPGYWAESFIQTLAESGITAGCGNGNYCPDDVVTRAQMAVFLERGMNGAGYSPPAATGTVFGDVGAGDFAAAFIEQLFADGITSGCGNGNYCADDLVTRAQMAVFLLRAVNGAGFSPPPATGVFGDVPIGAFAANWIEQLAAAGITSGCGNGDYCPDAAINRAQMAVFLVRAFGLGLDGTSPGASLINPSDGGTFTALNTLVAAEFDEDVANVSETSFTLGRSTGNDPSTVILLDSPEWAKLSTDKTMAIQTEYTITLHDAITDLAGNPLTETSWSFTTVDGEWLKRPEHVGRKGKEAQRPVVASSNEGEAVTVWQEHSDSDVDLWASTYLPGGGWGAPAPIENNMGDATNAQVAIDADGNAIAVWQQLEADVSHVWANRFIPGIGWQGAHLLETDTEYDASRPRIAVAGNGDFFVVWEQLDDGGFSSVWTDRYASGGGWAGPELLETSDGTDAIDVRIAADGAGNAVAVWAQDVIGVFNVNVLANRYVPGNGWTGVVPVDTTDDDVALQPQIAISAGGAGMVTYLQIMGGEPTVWARPYLGGGNWGTAEQIQSEFGPTFETDVAVNEAGVAFALWDQFDNDGRDIWVNYYLPGSGWQSAEQLNIPEGESHTPRIAVDESGNAMAAWSQLLSLSVIGTGRFVAGVGWSDFAFIDVEDGGDAVLGDLATDHYGNMLVVWAEDGLLDDDGIYFNRFGGGGEPGGRLISEIVFSDPALGDCVRAAAQAIFAHFSQEIRFLDCSDSGIVSLGGLLTFSNLETLDLSGNAIGNIGVLAGFRNLQTLNLSGLPAVVDIEPLSGLTHLMQVNLGNSGDGAIDCSSLSQLEDDGVSVTPPGSCRQRILDASLADPELQFCATRSAEDENVIFADELRFLNCDLALGGGPISSLSGIEAFTNLESINLDRSFVPDLAPLASLPGLKWLDISSTEVTSLAGLVSAPALEVLVARSSRLLYSDIQGEDPTGISILSSLPVLREAYLDQKEYCPGEAQCVTGGGRLDCETLDALETSLDVLVRPQACNMPIADVNFADANLAACVADAVSGIVNPETDDVINLQCASRGITQLGGLERFGRLEVLSVPFNPIQDLSPLNSIYVLKELSIVDTDVTDFYSIGNLSQLHTVWAENIASLTDIRELITMPRLTKVLLGNSGDGTSISCEEVTLLQQIVTQPPHYNFLEPPNAHIPDMGFAAPPCDVTGTIERPDRTTDVDADGADDLLLEFAHAEGTPLTSSWVQARSIGSDFFEGTPLPGFDTSIHSRARAVAMGDANGDGRDDVLLQLDSATDDSVSWVIQLSNGSGGWGAVINGPTMPQGKVDNARAVGFNDVNNDGFADILIENQQTFNLATDDERTFVNYYLSLGSGASYASVGSAVYSTFVEALGRPNIAAFEDINGDGHADLAYTTQRPLDGLTEYCFVVRTYQPGTGFRSDAGLISYCFEITVDSRIDLDSSVADVDGNGIKELVVSYRNTGAARFGDDALGFSALYLQEGPRGSFWDNWTELAGMGRELGSSIWQEFRPVAVADINNDLRADMVVEIVNEDGTKEWMAHVATVEAGTGNVVWEAQDNWGPPVTPSSQYRAIGVRDYNDDSNDLPDLLMSKTSMNSGTTELVVAVNNGASFTSPSSWYSNVVSAAVVGLEEDGLTNLANDTSELIAWVGDTSLRTYRDFSLKLEIEKGWTIVKGPELDTDIPVGENKCIFNYADADAGVSSNDSLGMAEARAEAKFGLLACNVKALDGRIELKVQAVYGGCAAAVTSTGLGGGKCEIGLAKAEMTFDMTPPPPLDQIPVEVGVEASAPNAGACAAVSLQNTCLNLEANLVEASGKVEVAGVGAGGGVGIGLGGSGRFGLEDGVITAEIGGKLGIGLDIEISIDAEKTVNTFVTVGEDAYTFSEDAGRFIVYTAGPAVFDAASDIGGAVFDEAGQQAAVVRTGAGQAVYFVAGETGRQSFIVFTEVAGAGINEVISALESAAGGAADATFGLAITIGGGVAGRRIGDLGLLLLKRRCR